jgi:hypothetical protein
MANFNFQSSIFVVISVNLDLDFFFFFFLRFVTRNTPFLKINTTAEETRTTLITDNEQKWWKRGKTNKCLAVKRGVGVRRNCNVFNLAMENVLKGLPDKIRDQLSRYHTQMHLLCIFFIYTGNISIISTISQFESDSKMCTFHFIWFEVHLCMISGQLISDFVR